MKTFPGKAGFLIAILSVFLMANLTLGGHASASPSATLSTDTLGLGIGEVGSVTFSGTDGGKELEFEWTFPKKLKVTRGAKSNLDEFKVKKGKLKVETDGKGSFSAEIVLSSDSAGTYVLSSKEASISFSPEDVTVIVGVGGPPPGPPSPATVMFTLRVCEGATWEIRRNMVLSDLYLFSDGPCTSSPTLPGPELRVKEGVDVTIIFTNDSSNSKPHALIFPGLVDEMGESVLGAGDRVAVGATVSYTLPTNRAGTFYYAAGLFDAETGQAVLNSDGKPSPDRSEIDRGMYGAIVVKSDTERFVRPEFDSVRFFDEIPRVVDGGGISFETDSITTVPGEAGHEPPTYRTHEFLVHGKTIDSKVDGNNLETVVLHGEVGEDMVMRMICIGSETHALHLHGHLADATGDSLTTDGTIPPAPAPTVPTDVVRCPSGDVRNLYVAVRAPGIWVWHCHRETHLLNNLDADYPGGMFTHLDVSSGGEKDD